MFIPIKLKPLLASLLISLGVGGLSALLTKNNMSVYSSLIQPPLAPPGFIFPVVWTILFILMGISAYLVAVSPSEEKTSALTIYGVQLVINFFWSIFFFNLKNYTFSFLWLLLLLVFIVIMTVKFYRINKTAGLLQIPYLLWVIFAGYLNLMISLLN
jgi:benzodiazapine receptor